MFVVMSVVFELILRNQVEKSNSPPITGTNILVLGSLTPSWVCDDKTGVKGEIRSII